MKVYTELSVEERATIKVGLELRLSLRSIARMIRRSPSTVSREVRRNRVDRYGYTAEIAQHMRNARRYHCRPNGHGGWRHPE